MSTEISIVKVEVGRNGSAASAVATAIQTAKAASYTTLLAAAPYTWFDLDYIVLVFSKGNVTASSGQLAVGATYDAVEYEIAVNGSGLASLQTWMIGKFDAGTSRTKLQSFNLVQRGTQWFAVASMSN